MRNSIVALLKFVAAGVAMGIVFGAIVYFGSSGPSRLSIACGIAAIPIAFVLISAGSMSIQIYKVWSAGSSSKS